MNTCLSLFLLYAFFTSLCLASLLTSLDNAKIGLSRKLLRALHHPKPSSCVFQTPESQWHLIYHVFLLWIRFCSLLSGFLFLQPDKLLLSKCVLTSINLALQIMFSTCFLWYLSCPPF